MPRAEPVEWLRRALQKMVRGQVAHYGIAEDYMEPGAPSRYSLLTMGNEPRDLFAARCPSPEDNAKGHALLHNLWPELIAVAIAARVVTSPVRQIGWSTADVEAYRRRRLVLALDNLDLAAERLMGDQQLMEDE